MRKKLLCLGIIITILATAFFAVTLVGCKPKDNDKKVLEITEDNLKTVVFSDLCFDGSTNDELREKMIRKVMIDEKAEADKQLRYNFIVVNGNLVNGEDNAGLMAKACDIIDSYGVPWAVSLGSKDVAGKANKKKIVDTLLSYDNCYFMAGDTYEDANYALDVVFNDKLVQTLYFLDTTEELTSKQAEWYGNVVKNKTRKWADKLGKTESVISSLFMNNPFKELLPLVEEWKGEDGISSSYKDVVTMEKENDLHKQIKELDSTYAIFFGNNPYTYFIRSKNDIEYTICRNMNITDDKDQQRLYGAVSYTIKNSKYMSVSSVSVSLSSVSD